MEDDEKLVEKVAREIVDQHGTDAVEILRERAEPAELNGDKLAAETSERSLKLLTHSAE